MKGAILVAESFGPIFTPRLLPIPSLSHHLFVVRPFVDVVVVSRRLWSMWLFVVFININLEIKEMNKTLVS